MARTIEAFKERIEITVDNAKANAALHHTARQAEKVASAFKAGLGIFNKEAALGIDRVQALGGSFTSLTTGPLGITLGAVTSISAAVGGLGVALFHLADRSAEAGDKIFELTEKSGFSASTVSAFKLAAESAGSTVEEFNSGLSKFNVNMAAAVEGDEKLAKAFTRMGVDIKHGLQDPEAALAQFMKRFAELPSNQERVIAASAIFGKKFGANMVGTFNQAGGDLNEFKRRMRELGIVIDDEAARASNDFEDMKKQFELQFGAMTRTIGFETLPAFMTMFVEIDKGLAGNRQNWKRWGQEIAGMMLTVESLVVAFKRTIQSISWQDLAPVSGFISLAYKYWQAFKGAAREAVDSYDMMAGNMMGGDLNAGFLSRRKGLDFESDRAGAGTKRMGATAQTALEPLRKFRELYEQLSISAQHFGDKTERARIEMEFERAGLNKLSGPLLEQALLYKRLSLAIANKLDVDKEIAAETARQEQQQQTFTSMLTEFQQRQREELDQLNGVRKTATDVLNEFLVAITKTSYAVDGETQALLRQRAATIDLEQQWRSLLDTMSSLDKDAGDFVRPDKWSKARGAINDAAAAAASKGWKVLPSDETRPKWAEFFKSGLTDALMDINSMFSQQPSKKRGLFSKILGFASPFLSFIPAIGPLLSMAAGAASSALSGNYGGAISSVAGGIQNRVWRPQTSQTNPSASGYEPPGHAMGLRYVPHDNYVARLHRGERVLTANENQNYGNAAHFAVLDRIDKTLSRMETWHPREVVRMGVHGVIDAMDSDAGLIRFMGQRQRLQ